MDKQTDIATYCVTTHVIKSQICQSVLIYHGTALHCHQMRRTDVKKKNQADDVLMKELENKVLKLGK